MANGQDKDRWFVAMLAVIICLLGGIGALVLVLNGQTWNKLDRITALFLHERDLINSNQQKLFDKIGCIEKEHLQDMNKIESRINGTK